MSRDYIVFVSTALAVNHPQAFCIWIWMIPSQLIPGVRLYHRIIFYRGDQH